MIKLIKRSLSLLWILQLVQDGASQYFICPYEKGLYYATSPDCLIYYRCQNQKLWSGVCFPWQRFDVHLLSCRYVDNVDCNPEYAGIWIPLYGYDSNVTDQEVQETNQVTGDEGIQGTAEEEPVMFGNEVEEEKKLTYNEAEQGEIQEATKEETAMLGNDVYDGPINNETEQEEIEEATDKVMIANGGEEIKEEAAGNIGGNEVEEVDKLDTAQAEDDTENKVLQGKQEQTDEAVLNEEPQEDNILQEKDSGDKDEFNKDELEGSGEDIIQENRQNDKKDENKTINESEEENKGKMDSQNNKGPSSVKIDNNEIQNVKVRQGEKTTDEQNEQENEQVDEVIAKTEIKLDEEKNKRAVNSMASDDKLLQKLFKNIPIARESVVPDLMLPIVTSTFEESPIELQGVSDKTNQETNCQLSSTDTDLEPFSESTSAETKQEDSAGRFWYWCGSGRFVMTQTAQDPNTICLQLDDPQFIDQEGPGTGNQDWGGHTFLGSDTSVSKRHTL